MAMRAVLKKISSRNIRFWGGRQLIPTYSGGGSSRWGDRAYLCSNNKEVISGAGETDSIQESLYKKNEIKELQDLCIKKLSREFKEEEQQSLLKGFQWTYLNFFLYLAGFQSRQLLSMKSDHCTVCGKVGRGGIVQFTIPSLGLGLRSTKLLVLHHGSPYGLPRQTVNGLVCITAGDKEKFLIYNPSTGETSPWIKTTTASARSKGESSRKVDCIAFGFDQTKNEHKVICVSSRLTSGITVAQQNNSAIEIEVLTIDRNTWTGGEIIWRICDDVIPHGCYEDPPVYVNGSIYWLLGPVGTTGILEFDVGSEKLQYHSIICFVDEKGAPTPTFQLMEFDGCVGILKRISDYEATVYVFSKLGMMQISDDEDEEIECCQWIEEDISLPCAWTAGMHLSIEALTGTNILFIQSSDSVFCYDRKIKQSERFQILDDHERIMQL